MPGPTFRTIASALGLTLALVPVFPSTDSLARDTATVRDALREGNRLFRRGDPGAAVEAYRSAGDDAIRSDPILAYNLATALHDLGRLPEAVLWYRRADRHLGDDLWVTDNLERARTALAAPRPGPPPLVEPFLLHPWLLPILATAAAWSALALVVLGRRRPSREPRGRLRARFVALLLVSAAILWLAQVGLDRRGPRPAVLLEPCGPGLPAGSEVWVSRPGGRGGAAPGTRWLVHGIDGGVRCPSGAVAPL